MRWNLSHTYLDLPDLLYTEQPGDPVASPRVAVFNQELADSLGLGPLEDGDIAVLAGNGTPAGSRPFAQAYAGHQYGHFTMLGDGRALVVGELQTPLGTRDLQLKGSGRTPYSRNGDGRAVLGPMLREYLMGEAMHALGIPTTRALAVVETGQPVWRDGAQPGAVLSRVASSHLRVGTFEYVCAAGDVPALRALMEYAAARHFPRTSEAPNVAQAFLAAAVGAQASLVARWMAVGFVHGVMNTDNMAVSGETIDYGPCAFLDAYSSRAVFSSIDRHGRYAYGNQPAIARWNLTRLAEALLPVLHDDEEQAVALAQPLLDGFAGLYEVRYRELMAAKLGLPAGSGAGLLEALLERLEASGADYTLTFRALAGALEGRPLDLPDEEAWRREWLVAVGDLQAARQRLDAANPVYIPRNGHVDAALEAAHGGDLKPFQTLLTLVKDPFTRRAGYEKWESGVSSETPFVTYCGT